VNRTEQAGSNPDRGALLEHVNAARAELLASIDGLSEAEMTTQIVAGVWTVRDILAHISGWAVWDLTTIRSILAGQQPDLTAIQKVDAFNDRLVEERRDWTVKEILAEMQAAQAALQELLADLSDETLFDSALFQGPYWDNLAEWLRVFWEHEEEHAVEIRTWRAARGDVNG